MFKFEFACNLILPALITVIALTSPVAADETGYCSPIGQPLNVEFTVTNAWPCCVPRADRFPFPLPTTPVPLRKPRAHPDRHLNAATFAMGFRLWRGAGRCAPASFRNSLLSVLRSTSPLADRRPKPQTH